MKTPFHRLKLALFLILFAFLVVQNTFAYTLPVGHTNVKVGAAIGQFSISLSGYIAPFASVVLTSGGDVLHSTTANAAGYFSLPNVLVKEGFSQFCLNAVDVKRLGQSQACFTIPPMKANYTRTNIFLPPTIGLFRTQIQAGSNAIIWGYSMPGATVTVHSSDGKTYTVTADTNGFYQVTALIAKAGSYDLSADAIYQKKSSEKPTNKVTLLALTLAQQTNQTITNWLQKLFQLLLRLGPLLLAIPIIILIYILWRKLRGLPVIPSFKPGEFKLFTFDYLFKPKKLHHSWMRGVGY